MTTPADKNNVVGAGAGAVDPVEAGRRGGLATRDRVATARPGYYSRLGRQGGAATHALALADPEKYRAARSKGGRVGYLRRIYRAWIAAGTMTEDEADRRLLGKYDALLDPRASRSRVQRRRRRAELNLPERET